MTGDRVAELLKRRVDPGALVAALTRLFFGNGAERLALWTTSTAEVADLCAESLFLVVGEEATDWTGRDRRWRRNGLGDRDGEGGA